MKTVPHHRVLAVGLALATGACAPSSGDTSELAEADQTAAFNGTYTVPVGDPALVAAATFPVNVKVQPLAAGNVRVHYTLPADLVGRPQVVDLIGPADGVLRGAAGTSQCTTDSQTASTTCAERLPGMVVDLDAVGSGLARSSLSVADQAAALRVAKAFDINPIGVLRFSQGQQRGHHGGR